MSEQNIEQIEDLPIDQLDKPEATTLLKKLLAIQTILKGLGKDKTTKGAYNPNGYEYVTGAKILGYVKPLMNHYGLLLEQHVVDFDNTRMDYTAGKDNKAKVEILTKVKMLMVWVCADTGDQRFIPWGANGQNDFEKGFGSALTYAERYFLLKYFHIATDEDDIDNPDRKGDFPAPRANAGATDTSKKPSVNKDTLPPPVNKPKTTAGTAPKTATPAKETQPKNDSASKDVKAETPDAKLEERKTRAKGAFAKLPQAEVLKYLIKVEKTTKTTVNEWIDSTDIDKVLKTYTDYQNQPK